MKKILVFMLIAVLGLTCVLTGCGPSNPFAENLQIVEGVVFAEEAYGIAGRKEDKAFVSKINEALIALVNTDYKTIAENYGLTDNLLVKENTTNPLAGATDGSWDAIVASGEIVIGYTVFAPIAFEKDGELTGFDIDLAKKVVEYLNKTYSVSLTLNPQLISWSAKETLLENGSIDLIWNGMTITPEREEGMCISVPYLANKQVAVIRKADKDVYTSIETLKTAVIGAEGGSAGEEIAKGTLNEGAEYVMQKSQLDALTQLNNGSIDVAIIDSVMAGYYTSANTEIETE